MLVGLLGGKDGGVVFGNSNSREQLLSAVAAAAMEVVSGNNTSESK